MLGVMLAGFYPYYTRGEGMAGRTIAPAMKAIVFVHGAALTLWLVVFFVQTLLVPARRIRLHRTLGWAGVAIASVGALSGAVVALQSVRPIPAIPFWGMTYQQFLLVMLVEVTVFAGFVAAGVVTRKKPRVHRAMMLLASLSILAGATVRMPLLFPIFGEGGWVGIFGPIFTLGAVFVLLRAVLAQAFDRWLVAGYAVLVVVYIVACKLAVSEVWSRLASAVLRA